MIINDAIQGNKHNKVKTENLSIKMVDFKDLEKYSTAYFSDALFANLTGNLSQGRFIILL